jgi:hypothetical protein
MKFLDHSISTNKFFLRISTTFSSLKSAPVILNWHILLVTIGF